MHPPMPVEQKEKILNLFKKLLLKTIVEMQPGEPLHDELKTEGLHLSLPCRKHMIRPQPEE